MLRLRLTAVGAALAFICGAVFHFGHIPALILGVGIFVLFTVVWGWYIPRFVNSHSAVVGSYALSVKVGVIIRNQHVVPDVRCVYCRKITGPVTRLLGIASVQIRLARRSITVYGLSLEDAQRLIDWGSSR